LGEKRKERRGCIDVDRERRKKHPPVLDLLKTRGGGREKRREEKKRGRHLVCTVFVERGTGRKKRDVNES